MKTSIYQGPRNFEIKEAPTPEPGEGEVLIRVDYAAICGSDLHTYLKGLYVEPGQVMGHEFAGTVAAIGPNYHDETLKVGQKVAANPFPTCGKCVMCVKGKPNVCKDALSLALAYGRPGGFAEYVLQPKGGFIYKLPDNVTTLQGALMEPLSVAVHAVKQAKLYLDDVCVIFGAGTIGNMIGQVLKSIGCITVIQVDLSQKRLDIAKKTGADYVINASKVEDVVAEIAKIAGPGFYGPNGAGADVIFEAAAVSRHCRASHCQRTQWRANYRYRASSD